MIEAEDIIDEVSGSIALSGTRERILELEGSLKDLPQVEIPVVHRYSGGIYAREITIPAGLILTGKIYKDDHFDIMVYGDVTVTGEEGRRRLTGFHISAGNRGKKRAGYTHAETRWITMCASPEMEDDEYIDYLTVECFEDLELEADREDYKKMLTEYGFTEDIARSQSENLDDQIDIGDDYDVYVGQSKLEGMGLFSSKSFKCDNIIMPARIDGKRTIAGRFTNHSMNPNAEMVMDGDNINLVAIKNIADEEITTDYRTSLSLQIDRSL